MPGLRVTAPLAAAQAAGMAESSLSARSPHNMNDNILYHALGNPSLRPTARTPFRRYNAKAPEKGEAKKSRTMMLREWVKDTREAPGAGGPGGEKRGFGCGPTGWSRTIRRFRQERDGLIERIKERIAGIYRELQALPGPSRQTIVF